MLRRDCLKLSALGALTSLGATAWAQAATQPSHVKGPVRITSTLPSGSGPDVVARLVADKLQTRWSMPVVVDPKPGGAGAVAINAMKSGAPNGSSLVVVDIQHMSINPLIFKSLSYDPDRDLVPVALLYKTAFFVTVAADSPFRTFKDLMAAAANKSRPLSYGSNAIGSPLHLAAARLETALGQEMLHVPYKETSQLYAAVSTGEVDWAYGSIATAGGLARGGRLRFLAVADRARSPAMPDVPTLEEAGGPRGVDALTWVALMASRGTPEPVVNEINVAVNDALAQPDVRERMASFGFVPGSGPAQVVADLTQNDRRQYAEVLKRVKVSID